MEFEVPDLAVAATLLEPDDRVVRGLDRPAAVRDAVSVGRPVVQAVTTDLAGDDAALRAFLADAGSQWSFHLVHLGATFAPDDGERFGQAWLTVRLARDDGAAAEPPIVWSLDPQRSERPVERTRSVTLGASLGFQASVGLASTATRTEVFLATYGLQEPSCTWEFTPTDLDEVRGTQRLALVARTARHVAVTGTVELRATLTRRRFGLFPYRSALDNGAPLTFALT